MKKIITLTILFSLIILTGCNFLESGETETTIGVDLSNYIKITTVEELKNIDVNKSYELDNDLDLDFQEWIPIGTYQKPYRGNFRGNGYTIANLQITENNDGYNGLFGNITGNVEDLNIENFTINFTTDFLANVGAVAGFSSGNIRNVNVEGNIDIISSNSSLYAGLLVGSAETKLDDLVIAKEFRPKKISNNFATGNINIEAEDIIYVGGLIGKTYNIIIEQNLVDELSISIAEANSTAFVGGLIGHNFLYDVETIEETLSVNKELVYENIVSANMDVLSNVAVSLGGLIGYNQNVSVINNFVTSDITLTSDTFNMGLLIGENWVEDIQKNLAINSVLNISANDYYLSSIVGRLYESTIDGSYYYFTNQTTPLTINLQGTEVLYSELINNQFYIDAFSDFDTEFINLIKSVLLNE
ncbi:MAG: hypothetical protein K9L64_01025 [Candidatus Izimaplasma sp.]|nr:hypothetical protein [Candidatus Izimaplasma bacterium]